MDFTSAAAGMPIIFVSVPSHVNQKTDTATEGEPAAPEPQLVVVLLRFDGAMPELTAPTRQQKITLGEMRASAVRGLLIYCADYRCAHAVRINADRCGAA